ncbi:MAG: histidine phosphatase family protein [Anaerolineae bacterium]|nr:histidine phosphatase family protein [Anaerolineae bacterium]
MVELWIARHGETDWNIEGRYQGQADPPLNAKGLEQAIAMRDKLSGIQFDAIYTSDLQRARQTAAPIAERLGLPVKVDPRLREINQGEWEGQLFTTIREKYPKELADYMQNPLVSRPPGGETIAEVAARVEAAIKDINDLYPNGRVLIISHGIALATLLSKVHDAPISQVHSLIPENAAPQVIYWQMDATH